MGATSFSWGPRVQLEANKCWFYSLAFSIILSLYELWAPETPAKENKTLSSTPSSSGSTTPSEAGNPMDGSRDEKDLTGNTNEGSEQASTAPSAISKPSTKSRAKIYNQLLIDTCDLFIPGAAVGWIPVGPILVGTASTISTTVAGKQIWNRVQQNAHQG